MSTQVTLTLPDAVYQRAERLAQLSRRDVAEVLAEMIAASLALAPGATRPAPARRSAL
jgi:predicted transcriptional regulator